MADAFAQSARLTHDGGRRAAPSEGASFSTKIFPTEISQGLGSCDAPLTLGEKNFTPLRMRS